MFDLTGKTALITGATGGIGKSIAKSLYQKGASVIISGTREERLNNLKDELGDNVFPLVCDLQNSDSLDAFIKEAEEKTGQIDILVNNAGITKDQLSMRMKDEEWDMVLQVNLKAAFKLSKACSRGMMKRKFGRIINISSIVGFTGNAGQANYVASKAGLIGLSKSLALELGPRGITVNSIAPGFIKTDMTDVLSDNIKDELVKKIPLGRIGDSDEIAAAAVYLASNEASYITGETIHINGGMAML